MIKKFFNPLFHLLFPGVMVVIFGTAFFSWSLNRDFPASTQINHFPTAPPPPEYNPNLPDRRIKLKVWLNLDFTKDVTLFQEMVEEFEQVYPNIDVEISSFVRESLSGRVREAVLSGGGPDVAQGHVYSLAAHGLVEPLDQRVQAWNPAILDEFLPVALNEATWENRLYGLPVDVYTVVVLYNKELFDTASIPHPDSDYDLFALRTAAERLTDPERGQYGVGLTTDAWYFFAWLTSAGTDMIIRDGQGSYQLSLNSQNNIDVLDFLTKMIDDGVSPLPSSRPRDYEDARQLFLDGKLAIYFGELQDIHRIQLNYPEFPLGVAFLPRTPARDSSASVLGTTALFIPRGARNAEAGFEFIKWASSDRYVEQMPRRLGHYPARKWIYTSPELTENLLITPFLHQIDLAKPYRLDIYLDAETAFTDAIKQSFYHLDTPERALRIAQIKGVLSIEENAPSQ